MIDPRWQEVTCSECGKQYRCTPTEDYYNNTNLKDGICEPCLLAGKTGANPPDPDNPKMTPTLKAALDAGIVRLDPDLAAKMGTDEHGEPLGEVRSPS